MSVPDTSRLKRYLTVILRWLAITAVVFVLAFLGGFYITENLLHKVYTATAQIEVLPRGTIGPFPSPSLQSELEIMESSDVLLPVIYDLGLDKAWTKRVNKSGLDALPPQDALLPQDALAYMHKILKLDLVRGTNIINIAVSNDVPIETARIANAVADRYKTLRDGEQIAQQQTVVNKESPVRIISRAEIPEVPSKPNKSFAFVVTIVVAGFLSLAVASFVEIIFLFSRASERTDN